jgi:hypothetical protein
MGWPGRGSAMPSAKIPPVSGHLRVWLGSVEGPMLALDLPATDPGLFSGSTVIISSGMGSHMH